MQSHAQHSSSRQARSTTQRLARLRRRPARVRRQATDSQSHRWTVYVRGLNNEDLSYFVSRVSAARGSVTGDSGAGWPRRSLLTPACMRAVPLAPASTAAFLLLPPPQVQFDLHHTFENSRRVVEVQPFEVTEHGWGEFEIVVHVSVCVGGGGILHLFGHLGGAGALLPGASDVPQHGSSRAGKGECTPDVHGMRVCAPRAAQLHGRLRGERGGALPPATALRGRGAGAASLLRVRLCQRPHRPPLGPGFGCGCALPHPRGCPRAPPPPNLALPVSSLPRCWARALSPRTPPPPRSHSLQPVLPPSFALPNSRCRRGPSRTPRSPW